MIDINKLREKITIKGLDVVADTDILEILDRLEAEESDALEQARLNGMGSEREAALIAKLEAAEKERVIDEQRIADLMADLNRVGQENEELRAKIEQMEKQEPVAHVWRCDNGHVHGSCERELLMGQPLYALPSAQAQPAPSVQDVLAKSLKPAIDWLRNGCDPQEAAKELELLIAAAPEAKP